MGFQGLCPAFKKKYLTRAQFSILQAYLNGNTTTKQQAIFSYATENASSGYGH